MHVSSLSPTDLQASSGGTAIRVAAQRDQYYVRYLESYNMFGQSPSGRIRELTVNRGIAAIKAVREDLIQPPVLITGEALREAEGDSA